jgi:hypothetical protein
MSYNLTEAQRDLIRWIIQEVRERNLSEEFIVLWIDDEGKISKNYYQPNNHPTITKGMLDALVAAELLICTPNYQTATYQSISSNLRPGVIHREVETNRRCVVVQKAFDAVDSDFAAPDTSFVTHLTPLADVTNLDDEIKDRCLPILGAGSTDPMLWDSAVRTAGVILEERLRDVGGITDHGRVGRDLVNDIFGNNGTLADEFSLGAERQGYRDLYAGIVGAFRNPYAHRLVDPIPDEGGALIVFINLLLRRLEDFR